MSNYGRLEDIETIYREIELDDRKLCDDFLTISLETIGTKRRDVKWGREL